MPYVEYDEVEGACPECGATFRSQEALEAHARESHAGPAGGPTRTPATRSVKCSVCGAQLASVSALQRHNRQAHVG